MSLHSSLKSKVKKDQRRFVKQHPGQARASHRKSYGTCTSGLTRAERAREFEKVCRILQAQGVDPISRGGRGVRVSAGFRSSILG